MIKPIKDCEKYFIDDCGNVYSKKYGDLRKLKTQQRKDGYWQIALFNKCKRKIFLVHRLVYESYKGEIEKGLQIDHINGDKSDNRLINLRTCTSRENHQFQNRTRNNKTGEHNIREYKQYNKDGTFRTYFEVSFNVNKKLKSFGAFRNFIDAVKKRDEVLKTVIEKVVG